MNFAKRCSSMRGARGHLNRPASSNRIILGEAIVLHGLQIGCQDIFSGIQMSSGVPGSFKRDSLVTSHHSGTHWESLGTLMDPQGATGKVKLWGSRGRSEGLKYRCIVTHFPLVSSLPSKASRRSIKGQETPN